MTENHHVVLMDIRARAIIVLQPDIFGFFFQVIKDSFLIETAHFDLFFSPFREIKESHFSIGVVLFVGLFLHSVHTELKIHSS
jgi:hypothetical protein